jgi:hypothetical protein
VILRLTHAGRPHEGGPACEDRHCWSCGRDGPRRWKVACGECFHAWRWGWLLSLHDWIQCLESGIWVLPRIPSRVWVCPCCSHDL